jgi:hypothetical protein
LVPWLVLSARLAIVVVARAAAVAVVVVVAAAVVLVLVKVVLVQRLLVARPHRAVSLALSSITTTTTTTGTATTTGALGYAFAVTRRLFATLARYIMGLTSYCSRTALPTVLLRHPQQARLPLPWRFSPEVLVIGN